MGDEIGQPSHAQKILAKVRDNRDSVYIGRIPPNTKQAFIELADKEFCGDYGMALKWIMDGIPGQDIQIIVKKLEEHEARIVALEMAAAPKQESKSDENGKSVKKMLDGKTKVVTKNEQK